MKRRRNGEREYEQVICGMCGLGMVGIYCTVIVKRYIHLT